MAILPNASPLFGITGLVGNLMFRSINGKTVVSAYTPPRKRKKISELQQLMRQRFADAAKYAKEVTRDPVKREQYRRKAKKLGVSSAYTAAITDYMRMGKIESVDTSKVVKKKEVVVRNVRGRAAFEEVEVKFIERGGKELAKGLAVSLGNGGWRYRYRGVPLDWGNVIVRVEAVDVHGCVAIKEEKINRALI